MNVYLTQIKMSLRLTMRNRAALVFGYGFPLVFFFLFGSMMGAGQSAAATQVVTMVLTLGVLGSGLFGAGLQAVVNREQNILRRFKVAPITAAPMMVAAMVGGLFQFMPMAVLVLFLSNRIYNMPWPAELPSLLLFIAIGVVAFCAIGNIVAAVVNSMQEAQIVTNILYMPMLLLGGATIPLASLPEWVQILATFLPSYHFMSGMQGILRGRETFAQNLPAVGALLLTGTVGTFLAVKLFRWEKEEKMRASAKFWVVGVMTPFLVIGMWQSYTKENLARTRLMQRDLARSRTWLVRDARIFVGDGSVVEHGSILVKDGKIAEIYTGAAPDSKTLNAEVIEAAGKTILPGLIDMHVHLGSPGIMIPEAFANPGSNYTRELAAYLYSGVTAVKSVGDGLDEMLQLRTTMSSGARLGAELFTVGPMFTTENGHGTEYAQFIPEQYREQFQQQTVRLPKTADEARMQVKELKARGIDGIKAILEAGSGSQLFQRMDTSILGAIAASARAEKLSIVVHTGDAQDIAEAIAAGANGIEHGSMRAAIPDELFARMKAAGVAYDPTLAVIEAIQASASGSLAPLERSLVQQVMPAGLLEKVRQALRPASGGVPFESDVAKRNLASAYRAGVTLVAGTDAGNPFMIHGPGLHRELQLWVAAGVPPAAALQAATLNAARALGAEDRIGSIRQGREANFFLVDGNPLEDISATERISLVLFKGERVNRQTLFDQK